MDYKHYIRTNEAGIIVHGFSDAFEQPQPGDLQLSGEQDRHFTLQLTNERGQYKYKIVSGQMQERTAAELDAEWSSKPPEPPSVEDRLRAAESALASLMGL